MLLDWQQYSMRRRVLCCGCDWTWLTTRLPCFPRVPPDWWCRYSKGQKMARLNSQTLGPQPTRKAYACHTLEGDDAIKR